MKKEFIRRYGWTLLGIVAGMVGGYLYWRYVGLFHGNLPYHFFSCQQFHLGGGNGRIIAQFIYTGT